MKAWCLGGYSAFVASAHWPRGDFNYDGGVTIGDFSLLASNFSLTAGETPGRGAAPQPLEEMLAITGIAFRKALRRQ